MRIHIRRQLNAVAWACAAVAAFVAVPAQAAPVKAQADTGSVCFYEHVNYQGASFCASATSNWVGSSWNDRISSVKLSGTASVTLYEHANFGGRSLAVKANTPNLVPLNFNDNASSFKVSDTGGGGDGGGGGGSTELDAKCTPKVDLALEDTSSRGKLFLDVSGANPEAFLQDIGRNVCRTLYKNASEIRNASHVKLIIRYSPGDVAWKSGDGADITVMISTDHLQNVKNANRDVGKEIKGILYHEMTHMYQQDDHDKGGADIGLIEGIADTVRFKNGFIPDGAQPNKNGHWNDGYRTTAFFLLWLDKQYDSFIYKLNLTMESNDNKRWSSESFKTITGKSVDQLWTDYRNSN